MGRGCARFENGDDRRCEVHHPTGDESNLVILELMENKNGEYTNVLDDGTDGILTLDILIDANTSSLSEIEKVLVCCPIWMVSS